MMTRLKMETIGHRHKHAAHQRFLLARAFPKGRRHARMHFWDRQLKTPDSACGAWGNGNRLGRGERGSRQTSPLRLSLFRLRRFADCQEGELHSFDGRGARKLLARLRERA
jgi:hypothetical protein